MLVLAQRPVALGGGAVFQALAHAVPLAACGWLLQGWPCGPGRLAAGRADAGARPELARDRPRLLRAGLAEVNLAGADRLIVCFGPGTFQLAV